MLRKLFIIIALASSITMDAQELSKEQLLQDYDYYFSQMEQIHPDPYSAFGGKEAFHQAVRNLRENLTKRDSLTLIVHGALPEWKSLIGGRRRW